MIHDEGYWTDRYIKNNTQWDAGEITTPLKNYFDQLLDKDLNILIHGLTGDDLADHTTHASWLGDCVELNLKMFQKSSPS